MKLVKKVVTALIVVYLFTVLTQVYITYTITGLAIAAQQQAQGSVGVTLLASCFPPQYIFGARNADNYSVNLNWTAPIYADGYNIYYSSNISEIMTLSLGSLPAGVTKIENISSTNWTDWNAWQVQKRYYLVSTFVDNLECLTSDIPVGKFTYYYTTPQSTVYGPLASNRINLYLNTSYTAEKFLQELPAYLNPTLSRLDKDNAAGEYLTTHVRGLDDGHNFVMAVGQGYQVSINDYFNQTIVGKVYIPPYLLSYDVPNSTVYGILASNWRGVFDFKKSFTAETFLQDIGVDMISALSRLDKDNASGEYLTTHVRGLNDGHNFNVLLGTGYVLTVNIDRNHTLCTNNCFV